jgi:Coenzyme PQQ synthesis protein D (PqqD)
VTETETATESHPAVSFDACYEQAAGLHAVEIDGETVIYVESSESLHLLDATATIVWGALDPSVTLGALCDELAAAFATEPERIRADVEPLAERLAGAGLITLAD